VRENRLGQPWLSSHRPPTVNSTISTSMGI
jgi:hypothetical protein